MANARQVFPPVEGAQPANRLLIFAGAIEFAVDGDSSEDSINAEVNEEAEVDEGELRTIRLRLRDPESENHSVEGSASMAAPGNVFLAGNHGDIVNVLPEAFGVNVSNALTQTVEKDLRLLSDVVAELGSQMNRMPYQVNVLVAVEAKTPRRHHKTELHDKEY